MFANCQRGGSDQAVSDVCKTPAPVTFVNVASGALALPAAPAILFAGMPAHNMATLIPVSQGDEAGVLGGVISNVILGPSRHLTGCTTLLLQGSPATRMTSATLQNLNNAPGLRLSPSQTTVQLLAR